MIGHPSEDEQLDALKTLVDALNAVGVDYMLTGSLAMSFLGELRFTRDIDVVIVPRASDVRDLVKVLAEDFEADPEALNAAVHAGEIGQVLSRHTMVKIDLVPRSPGSMRPVFERRHRIPWRGIDLMLISPEDLILAKLEWSKSSRSALQLRDIHRLLLKPELDVRFVEREAARMGLSAVLEDARDARYE